MPDNTRGGSESGTAPLIATDEVTHSGDTADVQLVRPVLVTGAEDSKTVVDLPGDNANGLDVDVTRLPALPAGTNNIGDVDIASIAAGDNNIGNVDVASVTGDVTVVQASSANLKAQVGGFAAHDAAVLGNPALIAGKASAAAPTDVGADGRVATLWVLRNGALTAQLVAGGALITGDGTNGLDVDVTRLPALVAGSANIGDVDVLTVPADPFGANADASVAAGATGSISAKLRRATQGLEDLKTGIILAAGTANIGDVDVASGPTGSSALQQQGAAAHASPAVGNPVYVAGRASAAIPTDVGADGDAAALWTNRNGANMVSVAPHIGLNSDPWNLVHEAAQYTSAQTSTVLVAGGASEKIVVTKVQIQAFATTAGTAILYFGTGAYSRGTNRAIFDGEFAPSATLKPGVILDGPFIAGANGDDILVTTTNALSITFSVWYYVIT
ncbi:MAG TPA: hypothetical protein VN756_08795 [Solirubrobacterales bacterium]|nr:hypothetical protein [Solirubrobacterales bacterium]